jgi:hypothetical protein
LQFGETARIVTFMSKGLGRIEREVLAALDEGGLGDTITLAAIAFDVPDDGYVSDAQHAAVRRALGSLKRKGLVREHGRSFYDGRRRWGARDSGDIHNFGAIRSNRSIARQVGLSPKTIAAIRKELS